jgi:transposase
MHGMGAQGVHIRRVPALAHRIGPLRSTFNERFKQYYLKRLKEGPPYKMAVLATAHKLIRVIFAMLTHQTLFDVRTN